MLRSPVLSRIFEILLCVDFDVSTRRVDVLELLALLDHVLKEEDFVRHLEHESVAPRAACEFCMPAKIKVAQPRSSGRREFGQSDILTVRVCRWHMAVDARHAAVGDHN